MSWGYSKKKHQAYPKRQRIQGIKSSDFDSGMIHHNFKKREDLDELELVGNPEELEEFAREKAEYVKEKDEAFKPKSDLLKKYFGDQIPEGNRFRLNLDLGKEVPSPLIDESDYPYDYTTFLTPDGYYLGMGNYMEKNGTNYKITHGSIVTALTGEDTSDRDREKVTDFSRENDLVRIGKDDSETYIEVVSPITKTQLAEIRHLIEERMEVDGSIVLEINDGNELFNTSNERDFIQKLRDRNLIQ